MRVPPAAAFAICTVIWGTTWLAIKIGYEGLPAVWGAALRFLVASLVLIPLALGRGLRLPRRARHVALILFVGLALFGLDYGLIYWGEQFLDSGLTAILFATMPLFVGVFAAFLIPHERMTVPHVAGVLLGLAGLFLIFGPGLAAGLEGLGPSVAIVGSAAAAGVASVAVRRWGRDLAPLSLTAGGMFVGALALAVASLALGERPALPATPRSWAALLYLVAFGSILSFLLYWNLLRQWTAHRAGLIPILTPVVAVVTGFLVGERLGALQVLGALVVLAGVGLSLYPTASASPAPSAAAK